MDEFLPRFFCLLAVLVLTACSASTPSSAGTPAAPVAAATNPQAAQQPASTPVLSYGSLARTHIWALTDLERVKPELNRSEAAEYISNAFTGMGYPVETQPFSSGSIDSANVVATKHGQSPQTIIVGAHYDSVQAGKGADDNASGVGVMLEVAELIKNESTPYTIKFVAFGAEEEGLLGSYAFVNQMSQADFENTLAMVNLDSLIAGDIAYVYSDEAQAALRDWTLEWAFGNDLDLQTVHNADLTDGSGQGVSDFFPFQQAGIPFLYFEATDWSLGEKDGYTQVDPQYGEQGKIWHTPDDTLEYIDATFPGRVNAHLNLYVKVLYNILTQYEAPIQ